MSAVPSRKPMEASVLSLAQLLEQQPLAAPPSLVEPGLLPAQGILFVGGEPKVGKSLLVANLALSLAAGSGRTGFSIPAPRRVLVCQFELPVPQFVSRLTTMRRVMGAAADENLLVDTRATGHLLSAPQGLNHFLSAARAAAAEIIVLDPLYSAHDQDENDTRAMAALCQSLLRLRAASGAALIVVHHVRKSIGRYEIGSAFRGSSALHAVGDSYLLLTRPSPQFHGIELRRRSGQQQVAVADRVQRAGAAEGAADLVTADRFAHVVDDDQRSARSFSQTQQALAQSGHGAGVVFVLIVCRVQRVQDDDLGRSGACGGEEVIQALGCAEQVAGGACIHEQVLIRRVSHDATHGGQAADELRDGQLKLADEHTARCRDGKPGAVRTGCQRQRQIRNQQRFADLRLSADKQDSLRRQQSGFHQTGRRGGRLLLQKLCQRQDTGLGIFLACSGAHSSASVVASSRIASFTTATLRAVATRRAVIASLFTLRGMPLVA